MRAPRYRFPDEVRTATRAMAARMLADGTVAETPEQLDGWLLEAPDIRASLERGGYGTAFTAEDLLPLLRAFVERSGGSPPAAAPPARSPGRWWLVGLVLAVLVVVLVVFLRMGALP